MKNRIKYLTKEEIMIQLDLEHEFAQKNYDRYLFYINEVPINVEQAFTHLKRYRLNMKRFKLLKEMLDKEN